MFKFTYPQKDSFISNNSSLVTRNFGLDEVIEVEQRTNTSTISDDVHYQSRGLIQFDTSDISASISNGDVTNPRFFLELFTVEAVETPSEYSLVVNPVSQSWQVGTGRLYDDLTTNGVSWRYREGSTPWEVSSSLFYSSSISGSVTQSFTTSVDTVVDVGGVWYETISSSSIGNATASIEITSFSDGDTFFITSSTDEIYSFTTTHSIISNEAGNASASVDVGDIDMYDRFCVSADQECCITFLPESNLPDTCVGDVYTSFGDDTTITEATTSIQFTTESLAVGKVFELSDGVSTYDLIPIPNNFIPDSCESRFFFVNNDLAHNLDSMSLEINSIAGLNLTASVSSSSLIISSVGLGELGNTTYILDKSDTSVSESVDMCGNVINTIENNYTFLSEGVGVSQPSRLSLLLTELSNISASCGFTFTTAGTTIDFTTSTVGTVGNTHYFSKNGTTQSFDGGYVSESLELPVNTATTFYFDTGSSNLDSAVNLSNAINTSLDFVTSTVLVDYVEFEGSPVEFESQSVYTNLGLQFESTDTEVGFQSGSTQVVLTNTTSSVDIDLESIQAFGQQTSDVNIDVTTIVNSWLKGDIPNNGFILRNLNEGDGRDYGKLRFYSHNTNTIYIPRLTMKWDDQAFSTGALNELNLDNETVAYVKNVKESYKSDEVVKLDILARDRYPEKTFTNRGSRYVTTQHLPISSSFAIQDASSKEYIIPFDDDYTKVSCDSEGSYFTLDMSSLPQERYYRILIKSSKNGITKIFKGKTVFKVIR